MSGDMEGPLAPRSLWEAQMRQIEIEADQMSMTNASRWSHANSTIKGLGTTSGKGIMKVGEMAIRAGETVVVRLKLQRASLALSNAARSPYTRRIISQAVVEDILEYQRLGCYTEAVRSQAWRLLLQLVSNLDLVESLLRLPTFSATTPDEATGDLILLLRQMSVCAASDWSFYPGHHEQSIKQFSRENANRTAGFLRLIYAVLKSNPSVVHATISLPQLMDLLCQLVVVSPTKSNHDGRDDFHSEALSDELCSPSILPTVSLGFIIPMVELFLVTSDDNPPSSLLLHFHAIVQSLQGFADGLNQNISTITIIILVILLLCFLFAEENELDDWRQTVITKVESHRAVTRLEVELISAALGEALSQPSLSSTRDDLIRRLFREAIPKDGHNELLAQSSTTATSITIMHLICLNVIRYMITQDQDALDNTYTADELRALFRSVQYLPLADFFYAKNELLDLEDLWTNDRYSSTWIHHRYRKVSFNELSDREELWTNHRHSSPWIHHCYRKISFNILSSYSLTHRDTLRSTIPRPYYAGFVTIAVFCGEIYEDSQVLEALFLTSCMISFCTVVAALLPDSVNRDQPPEDFISFSAPGGQLIISSNILFLLRTSMQDFLLIVQLAPWLTDEIQEAILPFVRMKHRLWEFLSSTGHSDYLNCLTAIDEQLSMLSRRGFPRTWSSYLLDRNSSWSPIIL